MLFFPFSLASLTPNGEKFKESFDSGGRKVHSGFGFKATTDFKEYKEKDNGTYKSFKGHWKLLIPATENHSIFLCHFYLKFEGTHSEDFRGESRYQCRKCEVVS